VAAPGIGKTISMENSIHIARTELLDSAKTIDAYINSDGSLRLKGGESGEIVKQWWGDDDYEYWVDVPASEIGRLLLLLLKEKDGDEHSVDVPASQIGGVVLLLLKEKFYGNIRAVEEFNEFCVNNGVAHSFKYWVSDLYCPFEDKRLQRLQGL
jgi:hypothetical protein